MPTETDRILHLQKIGGVVLVIIIIVIIFANLALIVSIALSSKLRCRLRNLAICCLSASDLLLGLLGASLIADRYIRNDWIHGCATQLVMFVFMNHSQEFVAAWYIVLLQVDYVRRLYKTNPVELSAPGKALVYTFLLLLPWVSMSVIVIPIYSSTIQPDILEIWHEEFCPPIIPYGPFAALTTLGFYIPAGLILLLSCTMIYGYVTQKKKLGSSNIRGNLLGIHQTFPETSFCLEHPVSLVVSGLLTICLHLPMSIFHLTPGVWNDYERALTMWIIFLIVRISKAALVPMVWLSIPDIRTEVTHIFTCAGCRRESSPETNAIYRRFPENVILNDESVTTISC